MQALYSFFSGINLLLGLHPPRILPGSSLPRTTLFQFFHRVEFRTLQLYCSGPYLQYEPKYGFSIILSNWRSQTSPGCARSRIFTGSITKKGEINYYVDTLFMFCYAE